MIGAIEGGDGMEKCERCGRSLRDAAMFLCGGEWRCSNCPGMKGIQSLLWGGQW